MPPYRIDGPVRAVPVRGDGELPELEDAPAATFVLEPRSLPKRRAPLAFAGWLVALGTIIAIGAVAGDRLPAAAPLVDAAIAPTPGPTFTAVLPLADAVELKAPTPTGKAATAPGLVVAGTMLIPADSISIVLELDRHRVVGRVELVPSDTFETTFTLPSIRSSGTMWIAVTAYDTLGRPLGGARRAFDVGRLLEAGAELRLASARPCPPVAPDGRTHC